jgi:hypothetical protein
MPIQCSDDFILRPLVIVVEIGKEDNKSNYLPEIET